MDSQPKGNGDFALASASAFAVALGPKWTPTQSPPKRAVAKKDHLFDETFDELIKELIEKRLWGGNDQIHRIRQCRDAMMNALHQLMSSR